MGGGAEGETWERVALLFKMSALSETLPDADVILIVPPFHGLKYPSLGVHLLQACGRQAGFRVQVLYANLLLASIIGEEQNEKICDAPDGSFAGERFFARCAFGLPRLGRCPVLASRLPQGECGASKNGGRLGLTCLAGVSPRSPGD